MNYESLSCNVISIVIFLLPTKPYLRRVFFRSIIVLQTLVLSKWGSFYVIVYAEVEFSDCLFFLIHNSIHI